MCALLFLTCVAGDETPDFVHGRQAHYLLIYILILLFCFVLLFFELKTYEAQNSLL